MPAAPDRAGAALAISFVTVTVLRHRPVMHEQAAT